MSDLGHSHLSESGPDLSLPPKPPTPEHRPSGFRSHTSSTPPTRSPASPKEFSPIPPWRRNETPRLAIQTPPVWPPTIYQTFQTSQNVWSPAAYHTAPPIGYPSPLDFSPPPPPSPSPQPRRLQSFQSQAQNTTPNPLPPWRLDRLRRRGGKVENSPRSLPHQRGGKKYGLNTRGSGSYSSVKPTGYNGAPSPFITSSQQGGMNRRGSIPSPPKILTGFQTKENKTTDINFNDAPSPFTASTQQGDINNRGPFPTTPRILTSPQATEYKTTDSSLNDAPFPLTASSQRYSMNKSGPVPPTGQILTGPQTQKTKTANTSLNNTTSQLTLSLHSSTAQTKKTQQSPQPKAPAPAPAPAPRDPLREYIAVSAHLHRVAFSPSDRAMLQTSIDASNATQGASVRYLADRVPHGGRGSALTYRLAHWVYANTRDRGAVARLLRECLDAGVDGGGGDVRMMMMSLAEVDELMDCQMALEACDAGEDLAGHLARLLRF
ncbi:hypothetical protein GGR52DRAFT_569318 [Hypoxylon sp. FL1284]|nr:hypothetical protein GGR52DRAFT_569318 [Hypoxylon sp. FL1284]